MATSFGEYYQRATHGLGVLAVSLLALGVAPSSAAISISYGLALLFLFATLPDFLRTLPRRPALIGLVVVTVSVGLLAAFHTADHHNLPADDSGPWHHLRYMGLLTILFGWAIYVTGMRIRTILVLALIGLLIALAREWGSMTWAEITRGSRLYGLRGPLEFGQFGATALLASALLGPQLVLRAWNVRHGRLGYTKLVAGAVLVGGLIAASAWMWVASGSRSAWLAILITAACLGLVAAITLWKRSERRYVGPSVIALVLVGVFFVGWLGYGEMQHRWERDIERMQDLAQQDWDSMPSGSFEVRAHLYVEAAQLISERPLLGWGPEAVVPLIERAEDDGRMNPGRDHFHNTYLHLAVGVGLPLMLGWLAFNAAAFRGAVLYHLTPGRDPGAALFFAGWGVFFVVVSLFDLRLHSTHGAALLALMSGLALAAYLQWLRERDTMSDRSEAA
ncbi:O-antigen ligase [Aquisalimonas asiatica]|uniref:O-antigen ligase n=2 Tax=Aquisalimonas asiatica TaxID=406100 RepID=A0A1H8VHE2_9GAMM|nr:O-antigen ligase [Aquisalimonas asiatica]